jgi:hypothetical protein
MISRVFRLSRNDPRFDQTRTGTISLKAPPANIPLEVWQRWDQQVFKGNRVRLVVIITQLQQETLYYRSSSDLPFALTNVSEVILQRDSSVKVQESLECENCGLTVEFFNKILPNLDILDIGALAVTTFDAITKALRIVPGPLHDLRGSVFRCTGEGVYHGCHFYLMQPYLLPVNNNNLNSLREIHLDLFGVYLHQDSPPIAAYCKEYRQLEQETWFNSASNANGGADWVLLQEYPNLERVTLKHVEYLKRYAYDNWTALPQEALIKFARHTPKLRWFCSDLTQENIAMLKEERPDVEFCN